MENNHGGRFTDGLIVGALIGAAAVFLLGTKKGNKIFKALTEEGQDALSNFIEDWEEKHEGLKPEPKAESRAEEVEEKITLEAPKTNGVNHNGTSRAKRFFKKAKVV